MTTASPPAMKLPSPVRAAEGDGERLRIGTGAAAAIWLLAVALLMTRRLDQVIIPQFYSEAGQIFFADAANDGWRTLWQQYLGYHHLVPRIIAVLTIPVPWDWMPLAYNLSTFALEAWIAMRLVTARLPPLAAIAGGIAIIGIPTNGVIFAGINCLHFVFGALIAVNLLEPTPERKGETVRRMAEMILAALSGPEAIILAPFSIWRAVQWRKSPRALAILAGFWVGALVQACVWLAHPRMRLVATVADLVPSFRMVADYLECFFGRWAGVPIKPGAEWLVLPIAVGLLVLLLADRGQLFRWQAGALMLGAAILLAAGRTVNPFWPDPFGVGARVVYLPYVFLLWSLGWLAAGATAWRRILTLALMGAVLVSAATAWYGDPLGNYGWRQQVAEASVGKRSVFVTPCTPGWPCKFPVPGKR